MSDAISAQNTYFSNGDGASPEVFTELAEVVSIGGPNETSEEIDVTHLRSTGGYREFIQSFKDGGEIPMELNMINANTTQQSLRTDFQAGTVRNRRITFPDGTTCTFSAFVKGIGAGAQVGSKLSSSVTMRVVGETTWVFAS
jgi:hypothetical protein